MKQVLCLVCIIMMVAVYGQQTDTLRHVTVTTSRFNQFNTGTKIQILDSVAMVAYAPQNLANLLSMQSQLFVKTYGQGSLASVSFRGAAAEHTAVLWKGFNLQNPMNGQVDFSLIQNDIADNIFIQYGGNGALFGSGAVGGIVQLQSAAKYEKRTHVNVGIQHGSFGFWRKQILLSFGSPKSYTSIKAFTQQAQNNFTFTNTFLPNKPIATQTNAQLLQHGFIAEQYVKFASNKEFNINVWYQFSNRNIPPTISVPLANAYQIDKSLRTTAEYKWQLQHMLFMARTAYFDETINYTNPLATTTAHNRSQTSISEIETRFQLSSNQQLNLGVNNTYINAFSNGYGGRFSQNRLAGFASYKLINIPAKITTTFSIRSEKVGNTVTPIMPAFGIEYKAKKWLQFFGQMSRSYRLPTFNEMYWITSQSTTILPEIGWNQDVNVKVVKQDKKITASATLTGFNRNMQNWIVWLPTGADWAPQNIKQVWSRGAETDLSLSYLFVKWKLTWHSMFNYVLSTNTQTKLPNDAALGKQLIYVPRLTHQHQFFATHKSFHIGYLHAYTGLRFTSTDNTQWLNDFGLGSVVLGNTFTIYKTAWVISWQVQNIWNISYQAVADRPMPGRNFLLSLTFKI